ncbi:hypothetical protein V494_06757 [Pseudogymnoascus sp. VKM F-4513 (FW-928)]|nr:hypothetical protein V494_06757 [Pseudogymnoascus sp. VKM F-4513 (FW-928)]
MCFTTPDRDSPTDWPVAYRIPRRNNDGGGNGFHLRRHSSLERHLQNAPPVNPGYTGKKFPRIYKNDDNDSGGEPLFPEMGGPYYQYPANSYRYDAQNAKDTARVTAEAFQWVRVRPE